MIQWNLCNEKGEILLKTHKFCNLPGIVFTTVTKSCLFSLSWKTTCLERPQNLVVALYRFHCITSNACEQQHSYKNVGTSSKWNTNDFIVLIFFLYRSVRDSSQWPTLTSNWFDDTGSNWRHSWTYQRWHASVSNSLHDGWVLGPFSVSCSE